jgi:hypothetical protein
MLLVLALLLFLGESVIGGRSLCPMDVLHCFMLPREAGFSGIDVQNHHTLDQVSQLYPASVFWRDSVKAGELPIWNPYLFGGHPQLGTGMWGLFAPVKLLLLVMPLERAYTLGYVLEFLLAGLFMYAYLREIGCSGCASFVGGCAYALNSGFLQFYWLAMNVFFWVPLILLLFERALRRDSWGYVSATALSMGVAFFSGSIQMAFYVGFIWAFYAIAIWCWLTRDRRRAAFNKIIITGVLTLLIASFQLLPNMELLLREATSRLQHPNTTEASLRHTLLGLPLLLSFAFPALVGTPEAYDLTKYIGAAMYSFTGYIGLVPFMLCWIGARRQGQPRASWFLVLIAIVVFVIFFTPLLKHVYHRFFMLAVFAMSTLAAFGVDALFDDTGVQGKWHRRVLAITLALCGVVAAGLVIVQWYVSTHRDQLMEMAAAYVGRNLGSTVFSFERGWLEARIPRFLDHYRLLNPLFCVPLLSLLAAAAGWYAGRRGKIGKGVLQAMLPALVLVDLFFVGRTFVPQVDLARYPAYPALKILEPAINDPEPGRVDRWFPQRPLFLMNNIFMSYRLPSIDGYESLEPENLTALPYSEDGQYSPLADVLNLKYVLTQPGHLLPEDRFVKLAEDREAWLYRNKGCRPRLQFFSDWQVVPERRRILARLAEPGFDPARTLLLETPPGIAAPGAASAPPEAAVELTHNSNLRVRARVRTQTSGLLLLADTWYPGWKATVNGRSSQILRADYILRAVAVPAGESEVEFSFAPQTFRVGAVLTLATTGVCVGIMLFAWTRRGRALLPSIDDGTKPGRRIE